MPLTKDAIQEIKEQISEDISNKTKWEILNIINNKMVNNPQPQSDVPIEIDSDQIFDILSSNSTSNIINNNQMSTLFSVMSDRGQLVDLMTVFESQGMITQEELNNITDYVNQTIPDPNYESTLSWPIVRFGRKITAEEAEKIKTIE